MNIDQPTAATLPLGTPVRVTTIDGPVRTAVRVTAPYPHMEPAFQWADAPAGEHPLAWFDVEGRVAIVAIEE